VRAVVHTTGECKFPLFVIFKCVYNLLNILKEKFIHNFGDKSCWTAGTWKMKKEKKCNIFIQIPYPLPNNKHIFLSK
jgi:hypothetical protein